MTDVVVKPHNPVSPVAYDANGDEISGAIGIPVNLNTLISGEDQTNDALKVEEAFGYERVDWGALAADEVLGTTGAVGDILQRITVTEQTAGATLNVYDGPIASGTIVLTIPAGTTIGTTFEIGCTAGNAGWYIDFDAAASAGIITCIGFFT